jgi:hypothetical protein
MEIVEKLVAMDAAACHQYLDGPRDDVEVMASIREYGDGQGVTTSTSTNRSSPRLRCAPSQTSASVSHRKCRLANAQPEPDFKYIARIARRGPRQETSR